MPRELVDDETNAAIRQIDDDHLLARLARRDGLFAPLEPNEVTQPQHRQHVGAQDDDLAPLQRPQRRRLQLHRLADMRQRDRVHLVRGAGEKRADDGECQRQPKRRRGALPRLRPNVDSTA